uniref:RNA-directed RNA polymerase L n=1 Tax=Pygmy goby arenavirus FL15 TaxID=2813193 RepID=A0A894JNT1_9VIRU|nr:MAG: RNA-dependent RNA polymerase [Pygmy goby arenavirus FL15]
MQDFCRELLRDLNLLGDSWWITRDNIRRAIDGLCLDADAQLLSDLKAILQPCNETLENASLEVRESLKGFLRKHNPDKDELFRQHLEAAYSNLVELILEWNNFLESLGCKSILLDYLGSTESGLDIHELSCRLKGELTEYALLSSRGIDYKAESDKCTIGQEIEKLFSIKLPLSFYNKTPDAIHSVGKTVSVYEVGLNRNKHIKEESDRLKWSPIIEKLKKKGISLHVETITVSNINELPKLVKRTGFSALVTKISKFSTSLRFDENEFASQKFRMYHALCTEGYAVVEDQSIQDDGSGGLRRSIESADEFIKNCLGEDFELTINELASAQPEGNCLNDFITGKCSLLEGWKERRKLPEVVNHVLDDLSSGLKRILTQEFIGKNSGKTGRFFRIPLSLKDENEDILKRIEKDNAKKWNLVRKDLSPSEQRAIKYLQCLDLLLKDELSQLIFSTNDSVFITEHLLKDLDPKNPSKDSRPQRLRKYIQRAHRNLKENKPDMQLFDLDLAFKKLSVHLKEPCDLPTSKEEQELMTWLILLKEERNLCKGKRSDILRNWRRAMDNEADPSDAGQDDVDFGEKYDDRLNLNTARFNNLNVDDCIRKVIDMQVREKLQLNPEQSLPDKRPDDIMQKLGLTSDPTDILLGINNSLLSYMHRVTRLARATCNSSYSTFKESGSITTYHLVGKTIIYTNCKGNRAKECLVPTIHGYETLKLHPEKMVPVINAVNLLGLYALHLDEEGTPMTNSAMWRACRIIVNQSKRDQIHLQGMRYFAMAARSSHHRRGLENKLTNPMLDKKDAATQIECALWMVQLESLTKEVKDRKRFVNQNGDEPIRTMVQQSCMTDIYLCHAITKTAVETDSETLKCFSKFYKPKKKFEELKDKKGTLLGSKTLETWDFLKRADSNFDLPYVHRDLFLQFLNGISESYQKVYDTHKGTMRESNTSALINPKSTVSDSKRKLNCKAWKNWVVKWAELRSKTLKKWSDMGERDEKAEEKPRSLLIAENFFIEWETKLGLEPNVLRRDCCELATDILDKYPSIIDFVREKEDLLNIFAEMMEEDLSSSVDFNWFLSKLLMHSIDTENWESATNLVVQSAMMRTRAPKRDATFRKLLEHKNTRNSLKVTSRESTSLSLLKFIERQTNDSHILIADFTCTPKGTKTEDEPHYFGIAPKEQIGGSRELFVGDTVTKLKMKRTEEFAREATKTCQNSCLNSPELEDEFRNYCANTMKKDFNDSRQLFLTIDHSKWGTTQMCDLFFQVLNRLDEGKEPIKKILLDHISKHVEIPTAVIEIAVKKKFNYPFKQQVFKSTSDRLWLSIYDKYICKDKSTVQACFDMGQGILHCFSDLLGALEESFILDSCCHIVGKLHPEVGKITHKNMNTSDDCAAAIETEHPNNSAWKTTFLNCQYTLSLMLNKKISEKSTADSELMEFKSIFVEKGTEVPAKIKQEVAGMLSPCIDSLEDWTNSALNLVRECYDHGSSWEACCLVLRGCKSFVSQCFRDPLHFSKPDNKNILGSYHPKLPWLPSLRPVDLITMTNRRICLKDCMKDVEPEERAHLINKILRLFSKYDKEQDPDGFMEEFLKIGLPTTLEVTDERGDCANLEIKKPFGRDREREYRQAIQSELDSELPSNPDLKRTIKFLLANASKITDKGLKCNLMAAISQGRTNSMLSPMQKLQTIRYQGTSKSFCVRRIEDDVRSLPAVISDLKFKPSQKNVQQLILEDLVLSLSPLKGINQALISESSETQPRLPINRFVIEEPRSEVDLCAECVDFVRKQPEELKEDAEKAWQFISLRKDQRIRVDNSKTFRFNILLKLGEIPMLENCMLERVLFRPSTSDLFDMSDVQCGSYQLDGNCEVFAPIFLDSIQGRTAMDIICTAICLRSITEGPVRVSSGLIEELIEGLASITMTPKYEVEASILKEDYIDSALHIIIRNVAMNRGDILKASDLKRLRRIETYHTVQHTSDVFMNGKGIKVSCCIHGVLRQAENYCRFSLRSTYKKDIHGRNIGERKSKLYITDQTYGEIPEYVIKDYLKSVSEEWPEEKLLMYLEDIDNVSVERISLSPKTRSIMEERDIVYASDGSLMKMTICPQETLFSDKDMPYEEYGSSFSVDEKGRVNKLVVLDPIPFKPMHIQMAARISDGSVSGFLKHWCKSKMRKLGTYHSLFFGSDNSLGELTNDFEDTFRKVEILRSDVNITSQLSDSLSSSTQNVRSKVSQTILNMTSQFMTTLIADLSSLDEDIKALEVMSRSVQEEEAWDIVQLLDAKREAYSQGLKKLEDVALYAMLILSTEPLLSTIQLRTTNPCTINLKSLRPDGTFVASFLHPPKQRHTITKQGHCIRMTIQELYKVESSDQSGEQPDWDNL